jgi:hypothetical protein
MEGWNLFCYKWDSITYIIIYIYYFTIIIFEDISAQIVARFRYIRAPDVTPYPVRGKT